MNNYPKGFQAWLDDIDNEDLVNEIITPFCSEYLEKRDNEAWLRVALRIYEYQRSIINQIKNEGGGR